MSEAPKDEKSQFIRKLKEAQENQRALIQAIDDLAIEQKRQRAQWVKVGFVFVAFIGMCWYSFESIKPYVSSIWTDTWRPAKQMVDLDQVIAQQEAKAKVKPAKLGEDAVLPTIAQEAAVKPFVEPLPAIKSEDEFYATFRPPPPEVAERLAEEYLEEQALVPTIASYNSVNQLPTEVQELDRMVQLDKNRR